MAASALAPSMVAAPPLPRLSLGAPLNSRCAATRSVARVSNSSRLVVRCDAEARKPAPPTTTAAAPASPSVAATPATAVRAEAGGVTVEFQRQRAKEMVAYFQEQRFQEQVQEGQVFGWIRKNEISNGRWTMFGLAVGLLTEYATGVDFPNQLKIIISNLGIADLD